MTKCPGAKRIFAIFLALLMTAQTMVLTSAEEIPADGNNGNVNDTAESEVITEQGTVSVISEETEPEVLVVSGGKLTGTVTEGYESILDGNVSTYAEIGTDGGVVIKLDEAVQLTGLKLTPRNEYGLFSESTLLDWSIP